MTTAQEFWKPIINDFNPVGRVRPEDNERFFVDRNAEDPTRSLVQKLRINLQNSIGQPSLYKALLTGHVGSGKSSELLQLGHDLAEDFLVISFDAELSLAADTANHLDVLLGMGVALHAGAEAAHLNPDKKKAERFVSSFSKFIEQHQEKTSLKLRLDKLLRQIFAVVFVSSGAAGSSVLAGGRPSVAIAAGALAFGATQVLKATRLELNVEDKLVKVLELPANRQEIIGRLNDLIEDIEVKAQKPVLVITDGLDKVSAARAKLLFADSALLTEPAAALVYAAPIEFYHRVSAKEATNRFGFHAMLPNPTVQSRPAKGEDWQSARESDAQGLDIMYEVLRKRFAARGLKTKDVITDEARALLCQMSGGVMRELVRSVREAATSAQLVGKRKIDIEIARNVVFQQRQEIAPQLNLNYRTALRNVLKEGALAGGAAEGLEDELLRSLHLLSYFDAKTDFWFDAHPNVLPLL